MARKRVSDVYGKRVFIDSLTGRDKEGIFLNEGEYVDFHQPLFDTFDIDRLAGISVYRRIEPDLEYVAFGEGVHMFRGILRYNSMCTIMPSFEEEYTKSLRALIGAGFRVEGH